MRNIKCLVCNYKYMNRRDHVVHTELLSRIQSRIKKINTCLIGKKFMVHFSFCELKKDYMFFVKDRTVQSDKINEC